MTGREQELINRYIYEVVRRVPKDQRQEIERELQELIGDMSENISVEETLQKLGDPAVFAKKYREDESFLIGPEYYDDYLWVMKLVMICVLIGNFVSFVVQCVTGYDNIPYVMAQSITNFLTGIIGTFGSVTFIFAVIEKSNAKVNLKKSAKVWSEEVIEGVKKIKIWTPDMLAPIPDKKTKISRGDCIASLIFIAVFACLLIFAPQFFGLFYINDGQVVSTAVFNMKEWHIFLPLFLAAAVVGFVDEMIRLVSGKYCRMVMISSIVCNSIQIVLAFIILKVLPIWNSNFIAEASKTFKDILSFNKDHVSLWNGVYMSNIVLAVIVGIALLETGITVYKTLRYENIQ